MATRRRNSGQQSGGGEELHSELLQYTNLSSYCKAMDKKVAQCLASGSNDYSKWLNEHRYDVNESLRGGETSRNIQAYGHPVPLSYEDAMQRQYFLNIEMYNTVYEELLPLLEKLEKISQSIIPKEVIKPTDLELGVFSFERALMDLAKTPALYSKKHKKFFRFDEAEIEEKDNKITFTLKSDKSPLELKQLEEDIDGKQTKKYYSNNKKSYLLKTKLPRPNKAVRIFVLIGANWDSDTYWAGVGAGIVCNFLESKGYAVRITVAIGVKMNGVKINNERRYGYRFSMFDVKGYDEVPDTLTLLYPLADPSFFRVRQFEYFMAQQWVNNDTFYSLLGSMPDRCEFIRTFHQEVKKDNIEQEKDTLYYIFGGQDTTTKEEMIENLISVICTAENHNKKLLREMGVDVDNIDVPVEVEGINCEDYQSAMFEDLCG